MNKMILFLLIITCINRPIQTIDLTTTQQLADLYPLLQALHNAKAALEIYKYNTKALQDCHRLNIELLMQKLRNNTKGNIQYMNISQYAQILRIEKHIRDTQNAHNKAQYKTHEKKEHRRKKQERRSDAIRRQEQALEKAKSKIPNFDITLLSDPDISFLILQQDFLNKLRKDKEAQHDNDFKKLTNEINELEQQLAALQASK